jgi:hypothetical protein
MKTATQPAPQHMRALEQANRVRLARAELKRQVADGEVSAAEVIRSCPWEARSMDIAELLTAQHRWGRQRCRRFLAGIQISETKTVGTMTVRQREALASRLEAPGRPGGYADEGDAYASSVPRVAISTM